MLKANFHTHTRLCDGEDGPEDMVLHAIELGFGTLGFSGHMDQDIHMDWPVYVAEITRLRKAYAGRLDILLGVELDALYNPSSCPGAEFIIGSTHYLDVDAPVSAIDYSEEVSQELCDSAFGGDWYALCRAYYELEAQVYDRLRCSWVGHFDLVTRFNDAMRSFDEDDPRYLTPALEAMEYLVGEGVPFEINCGAFNRGRKAELYPRRSLLRALHDLGGEILISSDAHQAALLDGGFDVAVERAMACGFTHVNLLRHGPTGAVELYQQALDAL